MSDSTRILPAGAKVRGDDYNKLLAQISAQKPTGAAGILVGQFSGGSTLAALGLPPTIRRSTYRTFWCAASGADVTVSAGAINNIAVAATTITAPADGAKVYIRVTVDADGVATAVEVLSGATVPADTTTGTLYGHKLLATVSVSGGVATVTPVGWNFSEVQVCSGQYLWGGFGS